MADPDRLRDWTLPEVVETFRDTEVMLYALAVGAGMDAAEEDLRYTWERDLEMLPTMASLLAHPGPWLSDPALGVDWQRLLHGEQGIRIHRPLPPGGTFRAQTRVADVIDRGPGKGLLIYTTREIADEDGPVATATVTTFARGDGRARDGRETPRPRPVPDRAPDRSVTLPTPPQIHLLYRLMGDRHPIHVDPALARSLGFEGPIMAGLCTYGMAGRALLRGLRLPSQALTAMDARFSAPAYPGEALVTEVWDEGTGGGLARHAWRVRAAERGVTIIDNGYAECTP